MHMAIDYCILNDKPNKEFGQHKSAHGKSNALERSKAVPLHVARQGLLLSGIHWAASPPVKQQQMDRKPTIKPEEGDAMSSL